MEQPKILGANIAACAWNNNAVFAIVLASAETPAYIAAAAVCTAPAAAAVMAGGFAA